jgi:hypothetical protein
LSETTLIELVFPASTIIKLTKPGQIESARAEIVEHLLTALPEDKAEAYVQAMLGHKEVKVDVEVASGLRISFLSTDPLDVVAFEVAWGRLRLKGKR